MDDFSIEGKSGPSAATREFAGEGEKQEQEAETQTSDGGGEQIGGGDGGMGGDGRGSNADDAENRDEDHASDDGTTGEGGISAEDQAQQDAESGHRRGAEIDSGIVDEALEKAIHSQVSLEVSSCLIECIAGDRIHLRVKGNSITVDVIAIDPESDECVGRNQTSSDWLEKTAMLPCGCYIRFRRQNVMDIV